MKKVLAICLVGIFVAGLLIWFYLMMPGKPASAQGDRKRNDPVTTSQILISTLKFSPNYFRMKFLANQEIKNLPDPIPASVPDSATLYKWVEELCATPHRRPGTPEGHRGEDYVAAKFKELGLQNVTKDSIPMTVWDATNWKLTLEDEGRRFDFPCFYVPRTGFTGPKGVSGEMVYVGNGESEDFAKQSVKGKIVVAEVTFAQIPTGILNKLAGGGYYFSNPETEIGWGFKQVLIFIRKNFPRQAANASPSPRSVYWRAVDQGAAGMILILKNHPGNTNSHYGPYDRVMKPLPALWVGKYDGEKFREIAKRGIRATILLEGTKVPGVTHNVWGILPGMSDEIIMISSHHDSPFKGATEDGTGVSMVLGQAWAWSKIPKKKRPRTLLFICDAGHFYEAIGADEMVKQHPDVIQRVVVDLNLEHVAAKELIDKDRDFAFSGHQAYTLMFLTANPHMIAVVKRSLQKYQPKRVSAVPINLIGPVPAGEGGTYYRLTGMNAINTIGQPYYLLTAEDTLDKVNKEELEVWAKTAADITGTFMLMKKEDLTEQY